MSHMPSLIIAQLQRENAELRQRVAELERLLAEMRARQD